MFKAGGQWNLLSVACPPARLAPRRELHPIIDDEEVLLEHGEAVIGMGGTRLDGYVHARLEDPLLTGIDPEVFPAEADRVSKMWIVVLRAFRALSRKIRGHTQRRLIPHLPSVGETEARADLLDDLFDNGDGRFHELGLS